MTLDVDLKHFGQNIQISEILRENSDLPSMFFDYRKIPITNIFAHKIFVNQFSKVLQHILQQSWY